MSELLYDFIQSHESVITTVLAFAIIFLGILIVSRTLLYQLIFAFDPDAKSQRNRLRSRPIRVALAIADIIAWLFALTLSCVFFRIPQAMQLLLSLFGIVWNLLPWTLVVGLIAFCFSRVGNELILSLIGFWYLKHHQADLDRRHSFDVGEGHMAEIEEIALLTTRFRLKEGRLIVYRPNAYLMHEFFGFTPNFGAEDVIEWMRSHSSKS